MEDIDVFRIIEDDAEEYKRKSIEELSKRVIQLFDSGVMERTLTEMTKPPMLGEPEGNCHAIALAFMTDLIVARQDKGWFWVQGVNPKIRREGKPWEHSWLECDGLIVDATLKQKENPDRLTVTIGEPEFFYKTKGITKILKRRNATQTRKWIFKHASKARG